MEAKAILERLEELGVEATVLGEYIELTPWSALPEYLLAELKAHKPAVMTMLKLRGYHFRYPSDQATAEELDEIEASVYRDGFVLLWSNVLQDLVAFYKSEEDSSKIPPGFVPYSDKELKELFGKDESTLRLIHEAKKGGAEVIGELEG